MTHGIKPIADFARIGLQHGLLSVQDVIAWADGLIDGSDSPPEWLINLAMARPNDIDQLLQQVPGESDVDLAINLLMGLLNRRWQSKNVAIMNVCKISWSLHAEYERPKNKGVGDWGCVLNHYVEEIEAGLRTTTELEASITERLQEYSDFERALPDWVDQTGQFSRIESLP